MITFFPPQNGRLSEYASMIASEWCEEHNLSVICQSEPEPNSYNGFEVVPVFNESKPLSILRVIRTIQKKDPDVVVFNQSVGVWGQNKISNFIGMSLPLLTRKLDIPTFTFLHNVYEEMEVDRIERVDRNLLLDTGIWLSTHLLLRGSNLVSVTMEKYRRTLNSKYNASNVIHIPHGVPVNGFSYNSPNDGLNVLAFGHWSPNKRLPLLLEAYHHMDENVNLIVGGTSHPDHPDYLKEVKEEHEVSDVDFRGYIPEEEVEEIFSEADIAVLPYRASVGTSGVLNLSMGYGLPVLATETEFLQEIAEEEDAEILFCDEEPRSIAQEINELSREPVQLKSVAKKNYQTAQSKSISNTCDQTIEEIKDVID